MGKPLQNQVFRSWYRVVAHKDIVAMYAKVKILKWDENMVNKIHKKGDSAIAQDLLEKECFFLSDESDIENDLYNQNIS